VPVGATVVGIPARVVRCRDASQPCLELVGNNGADEGAAEPAARSAFEAYGVDEGATETDEDPIKELREEIAQLRKELEAVRGAHESLESDCG